MGTFPKTSLTDAGAMQAVLDAVSGGLLYLDRDRRVLQAKAAPDFTLFRVLGIVPGMVFEAALPPGLERKLRHAAQRVLETGAVQGFEGEVTMQATPRTYQFTLAAGDAETVLVVVRDRTDHRELETAMLEISERERRRLGEDFHDDIGQTLNGIWFISSSVEKKLAARGLPEAESLRRISSLLQRVMQQFRGLVQGLNTIDLHPRDLVPALEAYAAGIEQIYLSRGVSCSVVAPDDLVLPSGPVATQLYRITQEAVTNAMRHGRATAVVIALTSDDGALQLHVRDNGLGMPPASARGRGFGLRIMAHRARLIEASLRVHPADEGGTRVTCTVPLSWPAEQGDGYQRPVLPG